MCLFAAACGGPEIEEFEVDSIGDLGEPVAAVACPPDLDGLCAPAGNSPYSSPIRVGASATSQGDLAQVFTTGSIGGPVDDVAFRLRVLRPSASGAVLRVLLVAAPGGVVPAAVEFATPIASGSVLVADLAPAAETVVTLRNGGARAVLEAATTYALVLVVPRSGATLLGVAAFAGPSEDRLLRRPRRGLATDETLVEGPFRSIAGFTDLSYRLTYGPRATVPGAPSLLGVTAVSGQASVAFAAPSSDGGSAIASYRVSVLPGFLQTTGAASPIVVTGLASGIAYTFVVSATNAIGQGPASAPSAPIVLPAVPGAPTMGTVVAGNGLVVASFTAPASSGGLPITSYTATATAGASNVSATGVASPITISGLVNGTSYTVRVKATTAFGTGPNSAASAAVVPKGPPSPPTNVVASNSAVSTRASVAFTPQSNNGAAITSYTATATPGNLTTTGSASPLLVNGLTLGIAYTFTVIATNVVGSSGPSAPSASFTPTSVPNPPTSVVATAATSTSATISFAPPAFTGGLPITSYRVTSVPGGLIAVGAASPIVVTGLTPGATYGFTVTATNARGTSAASSQSNVITLSTPVGATVLLVYADFLGQYINATSGNIFNQVDGSETDPLDGSVKVPPYPPGQVPTTLVTGPGLYLSFDFNSGRYYSYRYSYVEPAQGLEFDRNGDAFASVEPPLWVITTGLKLVDLYDGVSDATSGVLHDPVTGQVITGIVEPYTALATPGAWKL